MHSEQAASFTCTACEKHGCDACAFWPTAVDMHCKYCARNGLVEPVPWERRKNLGMFRAAVRTSKLVILSPSRFFCTPSILDASSMEPLYFSMLLYAFGFGVPFMFVRLSLQYDMFSRSSSNVLLLAYPFLGFVIGVFWCAIWNVFAASLDRASMRIWGESPPIYSLERAHAYTSAAYIFAALPILGIWLAQFYKLIYLDIVALRATARTSTGRALSGFWLPRLVFGCLLLVPYWALMGLR